MDKEKIMSAIGRGAVLRYEEGQDVYLAFRSTQNMMHIEHQQWEQTQSLRNFFSLEKGYNEMVHIAPYADWKLDD